MLSAFIPWFVALAFYFKGLIPPDHMNSFDTLFIKIRPRPSNRFAQGLRKGFLSFSIQQLVLSIGLLGAGIAQMATLTPFDFHTVIYMAWMSSTAHLATLFFLQGYFHSSTVYRAVEIFSMLVLLILLCVGLYPTTHWIWADSVLIAACPDPAHCPGLQRNVHTLRQRVYRNNTNEGVSPQGTLSYLILVTSYLWQAASLLKWKAPALKVLPKPLVWVGRTISHALSDQASGTRMAFTGFCRSTLVGVYIFLRATLDVLGSFAFHITIVLFTLCWGLMQILIARLNMLPRSIRPILHQWDFGEILPLILLLTPLYGVVEHLASKCSSIFHCLKAHIPSLKQCGVHVDLDG